MFIVCCLAVLLLNGCQNSVLLADGPLTTPQSVHGWSLTVGNSRGTGADEAAYCTATKTDRSEHGENLLVTVSGDYDSVLDRISDPFFGISSPETTLSAAQNEYLEIIRTQKIDESLLGTRSVTVKIEKVASSAKGISLPSGDVEFGATGAAGSDMTFYQGWCFGNTIVYTGVTASTPSGQMDCALSATEVWASLYKECARQNDIRYNNNNFSTIIGYKFGWWNWRVQWHFDTATCFVATICW